MKTLQHISLAILMAFTLSSARPASADSPEQAAVVKEKLESLRSECAQGRHQVTATLEELGRLSQKDVDVRSQFEKFKGELTKMETKASSMRERADSMKSKGGKFFADWEDQIKGIQNADIRKAAESRLTKRKKSYAKILSAMQESKSQLVPFMSDLNDLKKMFDAELTSASIASSKDLLRQARWHGDDVADSLSDVEKELDRVAAELAKYK